MTGEVNGFREAVLTLEIRGDLDQISVVEVVIDTGFTEYLTLPPQTISQLGLMYEGTARVVLANGSTDRVRVYSAEAVWDGELREIQVHAVSGGALLGMAMLHGYRLTIDVVDGGQMKIEPIA